MESDDKIIKPAFGIMSSAGSVSIPPILIFKGIAKQKEKNYNFLWKKFKPYDSLQDGII